MAPKKTPEYTLIKTKDTQPPEYVPLKIIDIEDIPKPERQKKHMPPEIKHKLIQAGFRNVTKTGKKRK